MTEYELIQILSERIRESTAGLATRTDMVQISTKLDIHLEDHKVNKKALRKLGLVIAAAFLGMLVPLVISAFSG